MSFMHNSKYVTLLIGCISMKCLLHGGLFRLAFVSSWSPVTHHTDTLMSIPLEVHSQNPSATIYKFTGTMADIFPKQSVWGCKFFSGNAENVSLLGCYAMYGPSGMRVEVIPEDEEYIPSKD